MDARIRRDQLAIRCIEAANKFEGKFGKSVIPPNEQLFTNGFGGVIGKFIYNTVTTFFVGEKIMIQVPTWFFPAGAGPYSEDGKVTTHGYPIRKPRFNLPSRSRSTHSRIFAWRSKCRRARC